LARGFFYHCILIAVFLCSFAARAARCQDAEIRLPEKNAAAIADSIRPAGVDFLAEANSWRQPTLPSAAADESESRATAEKTPQTKTPVESDLVVEGLVSYGHYKIFASGSGTELYTAGVEYDRHSWGRFLGARMDYVAEFLPVVLMHAPVTQDIWGTATSPNMKIVPGIGFSPIGFRWIWRDKRAIKPYLMAKGGMLLFTQKAMSQQATYENFSLQSAMGVNVKMNERWDLRLGLFSDFHFSNAFIVPVNPGLDVMNANLGLSYNFGK
jgi:Lipid A 3-O-deacylase (PagL)